MSEINTPSVEEGTRYPNDGDGLLASPVEVLPPDDTLDAAEEAPAAPVVAFTQTLPPVAADPTRSRFTREDAERLFDEARADMWRVAEAQAELRDKIARLYDGRAWVALGYEPGPDGWRACCAEQFGEAKMALTRRQRTDLVLGLVGEGMSNRAIAGALGVSRETVRNYKKEKQAHSGGRIKGVDGKTYRLDQMSDDEKRQVDRQMEMDSRSGMTQVEIADKYGLAQSTVSSRLADVRREDAVQAVSPSMPDDPYAPLTDEERSQLPADDGGWDATDDALFVDALSRGTEDMSKGLKMLVERMKRDQWQPQSYALSRYTDRNTGLLVGILGDLATFCRVLLKSIDEGMWPPGREQNDLVAGFSEISSVLKEGLGED